MNILIDGYNILKQVFGGEISERQRKGFAVRALEYANRKGHTIYLIFDGGPYARMTVEKHGRVITVYSGHKESADDIIKQYIEERRLKNLLVVTTDRQLNSFADRYDVPSIDSLDFYQLMMEVNTSTIPAKKNAGQAQKLHPEEVSPELDALMEEASRMVSYKEEEPGEEAPAQGTSKKEKRLLAVLKKL